MSKLKQHNKIPTSNPYEQDHSEEEDNLLENYDPYDEIQRNEKLKEHKTINRRENKLQHIKNTEANKEKKLEIKKKEKLDYITKLNFVPKEEEQTVKKRKEKKQENKAPEPKTLEEVVINDVQLLKKIEEISGSSLQLKELAHIFENEYIDVAYHIEDKEDVRDFEGNLSKEVLDYLYQYLSQKDDLSGIVTYLLNQIFKQDGSTIDSRKCTGFIILLQLILLKFPESLSKPMIEFYPRCIKTGKPFKNLLYVFNFISKENAIELLSKTLWKANKKTEKEIEFFQGLLEDSKEVSFDATSFSYILRKSAVDGEYQEISNSLKTIVKLDEKIVQQLKSDLSKTKNQNYKKELLELLQDYQELVEEKESSQASSGGFSNFFFILILLFIFGIVTHEYRILDPYLK